MKTAILLHGTCDKKEYFDKNQQSLSNSHWFPWLQKQLLIKGIPTQTPEIPDAYDPDYKKWKKELEKFEINSETVLIGHSCGGGFMVRWLTENKLNINKLILVAPWLDPKREKTTDFFDFQIDSNVQERVGELYVFVSLDDEQDILDSVEIIKKAFPGATLHKFTNKGHFTSEEMPTNQFPELLEVI